VHTVHNARAQMLARFMNTVGIAFIVTGFVVPAITGQIVSGVGFFVALAWMGCGAGLHCRSLLVPGRLRSRLGIRLSLG
jgi:hypothetical protein